MDKYWLYIVLLTNHIVKNIDKSDSINDDLNLFTVEKSSWLLLTSALHLAV